MAVACKLREDVVVFSLRPGWLRLSSLPLPLEAVNLWLVPNLLLQKLPAPTFTLTTKIDASGLLPNEEAGIVIMGMDYSYLAIVRTEEGFRLERTLCNDAPKGTEETEENGVDLNGGEMFLRISVESVRCAGSVTVKMAGGSRKLESHSKHVKEDGLARRWDCLP